MELGTASRSAAALNQGGELTFCPRRFCAHRTAATAFGTGSVIPSAAALTINKEAALLKKSRCDAAGFFIVASAKINHQLCWWNKKSLDTRKPPFAKLSAGLPTAFRAKGGFVVDDIQSLSHTKWRCQYHIVFAPKYRRKEIYGKLKADIGQIIRKLCEQKGVELIEAEACPDHIHMLVSIPPTLGVAYFMGYLKGKSSLMIFDRHANLKYKYGNRHFWCRGYYVDTVGRNKKVIEEYIKNQLQEDIAADQISLKEYMDPFTGAKNTKA